MLTRSKRGMTSRRLRLELLTRMHTTAARVTLIKKVHDMMASMER